MYRIPPYYDPEGGSVSIKLLTDIENYIWLDGYRGFIFSPTIQSLDKITGTI